MLHKTFLAELERIVGHDGIVRDAAELLTYESDALTRLRARAAVAVLPDTAAKVQQVVRLCYGVGVPFVARGHGTGLSGGALPVADGVLIVLTRLNKILGVDITNQRITVEPGVMNLDVSREVAPVGYYYAPDPSSQVICSIGGNVAEQVADEILTYCLDAGGSITGEHGVGADKVCHMPKMFSADDLDTMQLVRRAFDSTNLCNPGKVFPTPRLCGEVPGPYRRHPVEEAGLAERM